MQHYIDGQLYSKIKEVSYGTGADEKTQPEHAIHCEVILVTLTILQGYIMCILIFSTLLQTFPERVRGGNWNDKQPGP